MSSISSVSNLNVVILMKVHLPVHLSRHIIALWIFCGRDWRCVFFSPFLHGNVYQGEETIN